MSAGISRLYRKGEYCDEKGRDYFFDNAKFILIFFVVLAHAVSPLKSYMAGIEYLWRVINTLHMPCLIFISGYFAKRYIRKDGINVQRPFTYAILYIASQISVALFEKLVLDNVVGCSMFNARSSLWFLQCLFWWYLLLPLIDRFNPKYVMPFVIILGLLVGYDSKIGNFLAFSRMVVHLPFFLAGYYIDKGKIQQLFTKKAKLLSIPALAAALLGMWLLMDYSIGGVIVCSRNFWEISGFQRLNVPFVLWWVARLWFYVTAALLCFGFLVWVPRSWNIFTKFGSRTLQVYILHRFLYLAELEYLWHTPFISTGGAFAMMGIAAVVTVVLSLKPFAIPFEALQNIKVDKLLKPAAAEKSKA